jgi:hypothetical protein
MKRNTNNYTWTGQHHETSVTDSLDGSSALVLMLTCGPTRILEGEPL